MAQERPKPPPTNAYILASWGLIVVKDVVRAKFGGSVASLIGKDGATPVAYVDTAAFPVVLADTRPEVTPWPRPAEVTEAASQV